MRLRPCVVILTCVRYPCRRLDGNGVMFHFMNTGRKASDSGGLRGVPCLLLTTELAWIGGMTGFG